MERQPVSEKVKDMKAALSLDVVIRTVKRISGKWVDADAPLLQSGVDSLGAVEVRNQLQLAADLDDPLPSTIVFDFPSARQLASVLQPKNRVHSQLSACLTELSTAAVCIFFGGASTVLPAGTSSQLDGWRARVCGIDAVVQVPAVRWDTRALAALPEPRASRVRHASFVQGVELFDNASFAVSPAEAAVVDPCQRLLLENGYRALHHVALDRISLSGRLVGAFVGFAGTSFPELLVASPPAVGNVYALTGSSYSIASGRLSFVLGMNGPCATYDTACSAALVACHAGLSALQLGECYTGLVAGASLMLTPSLSTSFALAGMTSTRGRSCTFDRRADGYARGEGCGALAVARRQNADQRQDICGCAVRQDGRSASMTAPNGQAQQALLTAIFSSLGMCAEALVFYEAHGTGTALGDPIETSSLKA
eukprot:1118231-Prymnesium_polylepis.1